MNRVLFSAPGTGARGGDVHYLSVCGSGLLARVWLAGVAARGRAGHVKSEMHAHLRRLFDTVDERRLLKALDRRLSAAERHVLTTAAVLSCYAPADRLTVIYAGHARGWLYRTSIRD